MQSLVLNSRKTFVHRVFSSKPFGPNLLMQKEELISRLMAVKESSQKNFDQIAQECGVNNAYCAQLFHNQAQLKPETASKLQKAVPQISKEDLELMQLAPMRSYEESIIQEPHIYRMNEAVMHYGESIKALINEKFGDGIMSAIDFYVRVEKIKGKSGEDRVLISFNGKFLPHVEQLAENDTAPKP